MMTGLVSCQEELLSTEQYQETSEVILNVYGPQPVMRGGELRFLGSNLDKVVEVIIPGVEPITEINVVKEGVPSEIRIIVPKDGPEPGPVTLKTADGKEIVTTTELTYEEPILVESFSPASVAPGDVVTLKGDYFNLIHEVIFSEGVKVSEKDFKKHTRYEIQVVVPETARTGVLGIGDVDELNNENPNLFANVIYTEEVLTVAQPEVTKMEAARYKAGETVKITGKNFQYVAALDLPGVAGVEFTLNAAKTEMTFVLPAKAQDGKVVLVAKSGVEVEAGAYVTVVPTEVAAAPQPVKAGATLTLTGKDLDLVTGIELAGSVWAEYTMQDDGSITFPMPATAKEGDAVLRMENGKSVTTAYTLVKPSVTAYSANPAAAGSPLTFTGTDLDLVVSVTFGGDLVVEVKEPAATEFTVSVPTTAEDGKLIFNLANGTAVEGEELKVNKPEACYITELPGEDQEINGGQVLIVPVANGDKLTGVKVNGEDVNFLLNEETLYITIPRLAKAGTALELISSNGAVKYTIDCIPATITKTVIWTGEFNAGSWAGNQDLAWGAFDWSSIDLSAGTQTLIFDLAQNAGTDYFQISLRHGTDWGNIPAIPTQWDLTPGQTQFELVLTQDIIDDLLANNGMVITGANYTLTKISLKTEISLEVTLWEGEVITSGWSGQGLLSDAGLELKEAGAKAGQTVHFYIEPLEAAWQLKIVEGHWGPEYAFFCSPGNFGEGGVGTEVDLAATGGKISLKLTQEILDAAFTQGWWGNTFILCGTNVKCTKVTLE